MGNNGHIKFLLIFLNLLVFFSSKAQNHLSPLPDILSSNQFQQKYYSALKASLLLDLNEQPLARVIYLPSFNNLQVVSVETINKDYYLVCRIIEQKNWNIFFKLYPEKSAEKLAVTEFKKPISKELALTLKELFIEFTSEPQFQDELIIGIDGKKVRHNTQYTDGETYIFHSYSSLGHRTGQTRTPIKGTPMAELVQVSIDMTAVARDSGKEENLLLSAKKLLEKTQN